MSDSRIVALDVHYDDPRAHVACVEFDRWDAPAPTRSFTTTVEDVAPYEPGSFFKRELPCLLAALALVREPPTVIVIDGYVHLSDDQRPGLGAHLYEAIEKRAVVIGVAKTAFVGSAFAHSLLRGQSAKPLYITAVGIDVETAASNIASMHGAHRIPTLLKLVDTLCRAAK
ncbi:MAG: endonuclease V [Polyangiaceae bacterium]